MSAVSSSRICPLTTALCCLLLLINLSHRTVDANANEQSKPTSKKSLSSWIQSYKEPKTNGQKNEEKEGSEGQQKQQEEEEEAEEEMTCTIKVQKVEKHTGKCVRLRGGSMACQTSAYLDPVNADCMFLEE